MCSFLYISHIHHSVNNQLEYMKINKLDLNIYSQVIESIHTISVGDFSLTL
jgi:hypothetical protein